MLDTIGGDAVDRSLGVLRPGGHLVTAVAEEDSQLAATFERVGDAHRLLDGGHLQGKLVLTV